MSKVAALLTLRTEVTKGSEIKIIVGARQIMGKVGGGEQKVLGVPNF